MNTGYSVNGRHPYVIYCAYEDEYNNTVYYFKSENLWYDPSFRFAIGSEIDVYVDPKDYSKNYVDTEKNYGHGSRIVDFT